MTTAQLLVTITGIALIIWVNWYFFFTSPAAARAATSANGSQRVRIAVRGGYSPAVVRVAAGRPVELEFDRQETSGCTEEVVLPDFGVRRFLPAHERTVVSITPERPGTYEFTCGMGMVRGRIVAEPAGE